MSSDEKKIEISDVLKSNEVVEQQENDVDLDSLQLSNEQLVDLNMSVNDVKKLIKSMTVILDGHKLSAGNVINVVFSLMKLTEKMKKASGSLKKKIVLTSVEHYVKTSKTLSQEEKDDMLFMLPTVISNSIDVLVAVNNHVLKLKDSCFSCRS